MKDSDYHSQWRPASGHPKGWRVVRERLGSPLEELETKDGKRPILFRTIESARRRAEALNQT